MTETIQQLKEDIAILQEKLQKLEELQRTKSPAEEAFRKVYYRYPDKLDDKYGSAWDIFEKGYNASKVTEVKPSMTNCVLLGNPPDGYVAWNEWYNEMGSKGILHNLTISSKDYKPTPQTPEQTEKSLREAFVKAQQTEEWKETQRKIDAPKESWMDKPVEELVAMLEKNPPNFLKFQLGKSLEDRIYKWWETCFVHHPEWSMEECVEDLLDIITLFLPAEQSHEGTQNIDTVVAVEAHNELLQKIKSKLRNKK